MHRAYVAYGPHMRPTSKLTKIHKNCNFLQLFGDLIGSYRRNLTKTGCFTVGIQVWVWVACHTHDARITHKETYFRAEYVPTGCTYGTVRADTHGSYATPAQGRITHKYVIQDYVPARFKGGLRSKPPSHTRKRDTNQHTEQT